MYRPLDLRNSDNVSDLIQFSYASDPIKCAALRLDFQFNRAVASESVRLTSVIFAMCRLIASVWEPSSRPAPEAN